MKYKLTIGFKGDTKPLEVECKGHYFPQDVPGFMVIVHEDERRMLLNLQDVLTIAIPKEVFDENKNQAQNPS